MLCAVVTCPIESIHQMVENRIRLAHPEYTLPQLKEAVSRRYYQSDYGPRELDERSQAVRQWWENRLKT